jgi:leader peptidase (prepilin peptidase)/N-methyltransferase
MEIFEFWPLTLPLAAGLLGLLVGSFLNVVAYRLPVMLERAWALTDPLGTDGEIKQADERERFDLWWPGSACPACKHAIPAADNLPVLSFLLLRGRCRHCHTRISARYPLVEALSCATSIVVAVNFGASPALAGGLLLTWFLIALVLIDIDHKLLPDDLTLPLLWSGLLFSLLPTAQTAVFADTRSAIIGAAAGYLSLWGVFQLFKLATGKEGMGYGDFKLLAALGAWLGWQMLPVIILLSAAVGSVVGLSMLALGRGTRNTAIAFGPFLAAAGWIAMLYGDAIVRWYLVTMT